MIEAIDNILMWATVVILLLALGVATFIATTVIIDDYFKRREMNDAAKRLAEAIAKSKDDNHLRPC